MKTVHHYHRTRPGRRTGTQARMTAMRSPACSCISVTAARAWLMVPVRAWLGRCGTAPAPSRTRRRTSAHAAHRALETASARCAGGRVIPRSSCRPRLPHPAGPRSPVGPSRAAVGTGLLPGCRAPRPRDPGTGWHSRQGPATLVLAARDLRLRTHPVAALASILPGKTILAGRRRGTGPGSGRRDRAGARRGLGHQPATGDGEGSGRANGRPEESPPGNPGAAW